MKKIIFSLSVLILTLPCFAQQTGQQNRQDPEARAKELTKKMKDIIQFSDEQEKKVYDLNLDYGKKRREAYQNRTEDRDAMREKTKIINEEYDASLKKILDEKQFKKYLEEKENIRARPPRAGEGRPTGNRGGGGEN